MSTNGAISYELSVVEVDQNRGAGSWIVEGQELVGWNVGRVSEKLGATCDCIRDITDRGLRAGIRIRCCWGWRGRSHQRFRQEQSDDRASNKAKHSVKELSSFPLELCSLLSACVDVRSK
jgi:hypothetical protein